MLLTIEQAATQMNIPAAALRREADRPGLLVRFGRAVRIDPQTMPELIEKCRNAPKVRELLAHRRATPADDLRAAMLRWCDARQRDVLGCAELNAQEEAAAIIWLNNFRAALSQNGGAA